MAVARIGRMPRKATLEARYSPRIAAAVTNPLARRGLDTALGEPHPDPVTGLRHRARFRAATPRPHSCRLCFVVERASCGAPTNHSPIRHVRLATPAGAAIATGDAVVRQAAPRDCIRGKGVATPRTSRESRSSSSARGHQQAWMCADAPTGTEFAESRFPSKQVALVHSLGKNRARQSLRMLDECTTAELGRSGGV